MLVWCVTTISGHYIYAHAQTQSYNVLSKRARRLLSIVTREVCLLEFRALLTACLSNRQVLWVSRGARALCDGSAPCGGYRGTQKIT
eukprot:6199423-Pleurochrysis_carterae.AAC.1